MEIINGSGNFYPIVNQVQNNLFMAIMPGYYYTEKVYVASDSENKWSLAGVAGNAKGFSMGQGDTIYSIVADPIYNLSIFYTTNIGSDWKKFTDINVPIDSPTLYYDKTWSINCANSNAILFESDTALYLSRDRGNTWKQIGLPFDTVTQIVINNDGRLFTERPVNSAQFPSQNGY